MTSFSFEDRYQLLKCVAVADGIRTHNALEVVTGRVVMVHLLDAAGPDDVERLRAQLGRLPQSDKVRILETATLPAGFALVSEFLQGLTTFPDWLAARVMPEPPDDVSGPQNTATERGVHVRAEEATKPPGISRNFLEPFRKPRTQRDRQHRLLGQRLRRGPTRAALRQLLPFHAATRCRRHRPVSCPLSRSLLRPRHGQPHRPWCRRPLRRHYLAQR